MKGNYRENLTVEEFERFQKETLKRFMEILGKHGESSQKFKYENDDVKGEGGYWILPCDDCRHFGDCKYYQTCIDAVNLGKGLKHFKEKVN